MTLLGTANEPHQRWSGIGNDVRPVEGLLAYQSEVPRHVSIDEALPPVFAVEEGDVLRVLALLGSCLRYSLPTTTRSF